LGVITAETRVRLVSAWGSESRPIGGMDTLPRTPCQMSHFRRLARDQQRLAEVLKGFHLIAFTMLMWLQVLPVLKVI
jgi:hypothetical protein